MLKVMGESGMRNRIFAVSKYLQLPHPPQNPKLNNYRGESFIVVKPGRCTPLMK